VALYTTRYLPVLIFLFYLLEKESEQPAHLFRTMAQQGEWTPMTVYDWQVSGIQCMLSHSSCLLPLAVMALTSYKPTTSTSIASNLSLVFISHVSCNLLDKSALHATVGFSIFLVGEDSILVNPVKYSNS
jgi:hypothetical protein